MTRRSAFTLIFLLLALAMLSTVQGRALPRLQAAPSNFVVSASPSQLSLAQGATSSSTITVTAEGGYQGNVTLLLAETYDSIDIKVQFTPQVLQLNSTHQTVDSLARVSVFQWTLPGSYMIDVEAYDGIVQHSSQISLTVTGQDFSISTSPSRMDVPIGQNKTFDATVSVTSVGGFAGTVSLTVSVSSSYPPVPMLPNATLSANMVTVSPISPASLLLAISVNSSLVAHQYSIEVDGTGATTAGVLRLSGVGVIVGPDFNMSMQTRNLVVHRGSIGSATLTFTSINGYSGTIAAYSGLISVNPPNPDIPLYPPSVSLTPGGTNGSLIVVKTDDRTGLGTYHVGIEATDDISGGYLGEFLPYTVTVLGPSAGPDFVMYADPSQISASLGTTVNSTINLIGVSGYSGPVYLHTSAGASLNPSFLTLSSTANQSSIFSLKLPGPTPGGGGPGWWYASGIGTVIVNAVDPTGLTHEASINITVTPFSFMGSLTRPQMGPNSNATIGLFVGALGGFNGTVAMTVAGSPEIIATLGNTLLNFSAPPSSLESQLKLHVPPGTSDGDYLIQVTATYMRPERLPFSISPKEALTYTIPFHVIVTSSANPVATTILGLQPIAFYASLAGLSVATAISVTYLVLRRRKPT